MEDDALASAYSPSSINRMSRQQREKKNLQSARFNTPTGRPSSLKEPRSTLHPSLDELISTRRSEGQNSQLKWIVGAVVLLAVVVFLTYSLYSKNQHTKNASTWNNEGVGQASGEYAESSNFRDRDREEQKKNGVDETQHLNPKTPSSPGRGGFPVRVGSLGTVEQLRQRSPVLVMVTEDDCALCQRMMPSLEQLATKIPIPVMVVKQRDLPLPDRPMALPAFYLAGPRGLKESFNETRASHSSAAHLEQWVRSTRLFDDWNKSREAAART